jgi:hypothetical protein
VVAGKESARAAWRACGTLAAVFALYATITACFWAPAGSRFINQFIGDGGDNFVFVWNPWWVTRCLAQHRSPYFCELQYAPFGTPLVFHCLALVPTLVIAGLTKLVSLPLAYNLVAAGLSPVAGLCAYALAWHVTRDRVAAAVGGVVFMLCPYMESKLLGHMNLSCAAFLPLYTLWLLRTVDEKGRSPRVWLTLSYVLILFSSEPTLVFAANVTVWYWLYRTIRSRQWRDEVHRFWWALRPVAIITAVWGAFLLYYAARYGVVPARHGTLIDSPEPLNFVLPIHSMSVWRQWLAPSGGLGVRLSNLELAVYLGWFVLPMAIAGLWCRRRDPLMRFVAIVFACAAVLALGHKLQWHRQVVRVFDHGVRLPMVFYRHIPVLGAVGQCGRYMAIGYMAMAVMVAGLIAHIRERSGRRSAAAVAVIAVGLICLDYAHIAPTVKAPACVIPPGAGRVMDPRIEISHSLYCQTHHGRPLVGGYISRPPSGLRERYEAMPGIGWFFQDPKRRGSPPSPEDVRADLRKLGIEYVCVAPQSEDRHVLEAAGFRVIHEDGFDATLAVGDGR